MLVAGPIIKKVWPFIIRCDVITSTSQRTARAAFFNTLILKLKYLN